MITIKYSDGRTSEHDTINQAEAEIESQYPDAVYCDNGWEPCSPDAERLLVWANESDADGPDGMGDGGQNSIAQLIR